MGRKRSKRFIAVAGNMGAGKTELVQFLCRRYDLEPLYEPHADNPYLADFYADMKRWAFHSQLAFLAHKLKLHRRLEEAPGTVVQDRTIYEDAEVFARNLYRQRLISKRDFQTYEALYEAACQRLRPPDLMIFLRASPGTIRKRIALRGRPEEQAVPANYVRRLNKLYDEWIERYDLSEVITLDTGRLDYLTNLVDRIDLMRQIERHVA
jgi:deoxyadenosine/deoxycytidine kinase